MGKQKICSMIRREIQLPGQLILRVSQSWWYCNARPTWRKDARFLIIYDHLDTENEFFGAFLSLFDGWPQLTFGTDMVVISEEAEPPETKNRKFTLAEKIVKINNLLLANLRVIETTVSSDEITHFWRYAKTEATSFHQFFEKNKKL